MHHFGKRLFGNQPYEDGSRLGALVLHVASPSRFVNPRSTQGLLILTHGRLLINQHSALPRSTGRLFHLPYCTSVPCWRLFAVRNRTIQPALGRRRCIDQHIVRPIGSMPGANRIRSGLNETYVQCTVYIKKHPCLFCSNTVLKTSSQRPSKTCLFACVGED